MEYQTKTTDSGIVRCDVFSDDFKTDCVSVELYLPLSADTATQISLLTDVLQRGTSRYGEMDRINAFLEENYSANLGVSTHKSGELQGLIFSVRYLDDRFALDGEKVSENLVSLLRSVIFEPMTENGGFRADFVSQEKQNLRNRIGGLINDKRAYSLEKCKQAMCEKERFGVYEQGDLSRIDEITPASLYAFYQHALKTGMLFICYAGKRCDADALLQSLMSGFSGAKRAVPPTEVINEVASVKRVTEELPVVQSKLNMGFRLGAAAKADPFAARMFNVLFGGSTTSKLFLNVREKLSLCYYCASTCDYIKNVMFVYSGVETANAGKAENEILSQLDAMKNGDFSDEDFKNAQAYLIDSYVQASDSLSAQTAIFVTATLAGHGLTAAEQIEEIKKVTPGRVKTVARDVTLDTVYLLKGVGGSDDE